MTDARAMPPGVAMLPIDLIDPCPIQPRTAPSAQLIGKLSESMRRGRYLPMLEVEPSTSRGRYSIVCGEQRWRAARAAGADEVLAQVHDRRLGHLDRLQRQYEENQLRAGLTPIDEAHGIQLAKTIRDVLVAERLLGDAGIVFVPLAEKSITRREEFGDHLDQLAALMVAHEVHVVRSEGCIRPGPLSPWRETEAALGLSESARKAKLSLLRLDPETQDHVRGLPAEHAIQLARLEDPARRSELASHAGRLTHLQVRDAVGRLREDRELTVEEALAAAGRRQRPSPQMFSDRLEQVADLCRQLIRLLEHLASSATPEERRAVIDVVAIVPRALGSFDEDRADVGLPS